MASGLSSSARSHSFRPYRIFGAVVDMRSMGNKGNNVPKSSHIAPNSYSPHNESCENNNMGTHMRVHFKELNDMHCNLMAV